MRSVVVYSVLRVLAFLVPFGLLMLFPAFQELPWLAALFAAVIGLALSMLFLRRPLEAVSTGLSERRTSRRAQRADADVEDEAADAVRAASAAPDAESAADRNDEDASDPDAGGPDAGAATDPDARDAARPLADGPEGQPTNAQNSSTA